MDEFPEFRSDALEVLRQPIEERLVNLSRANYSITYPANFMLVARTIADLEESDHILASHVAEAVN